MAAVEFVGIKWRVNRDCSDRRARLPACLEGGSCLERLDTKPDRNFRIPGGTRDKSVKGQKICCVRGTVL
jgi:hypothetical protein